MIFSGSSEIVSHLLQRHLITASEIVDAGLQLVNEKRERYVLSSVKIGNKSRYMVKLARTYDLIGDLRREILAYRIIQENRNLDSIAPTLVADDPQLSILITRLIDGAIPANSHLPSEESAHLLGARIGRLHAYTRGYRNKIGSTRRPWILASLSRHSRWQLPELNILPTRADHKRILKSGLERGYLAWHPSALIHGDLKWEHCLIEPGQNNDQMFLIDWELATFGDPAWDIGSMVSDILFNTQYGRGAAIKPLRESLRETEASIFFRGYTQQQPIDIETLKRVALFTGARLFQTCVESASAFGVSEESGVDTLLAMALDIFCNSAGFSEDLYQVCLE